MTGPLTLIDLAPYDQTIRHLKADLVRLRRSYGDRRSALLEAHLEAVILEKGKALARNEIVEALLGRYPQ